MGASLVAPDHNLHGRLKLSSNHSWRAERGVTVACGTNLVSAGSCLRCFGGCKSVEALRVLAANSQVKFHKLALMHIHHTFIVHRLL